MKGISEEALNKLIESNKIHKQGEALIEEASELAKDYFMEVIKIIDDADKMPFDEFTGYLFKMPPSFYRIEARAYYNKKFKTLA